jgi:orotidine-5'-phosphate decarboxylase
MDEGIIGFAPGPLKVRDFGPKRMECMMDHFADRLVAAIKSKGTPICLGLDPRWEQLPEPVRAEALRAQGDTPRARGEAFLTFNRALLDAVADLVPVCKPQVAFYEQYGVDGWRALQETICYARAKGVLVISDAKRGDIGSTAEAYAEAHLTDVAGALNADALTVNPFMGGDTLQPFLKVCAARGRGLFALVKTSNPGSGDLQDLTVDGRPLYERVAMLVGELGRSHVGACGFSAIGAVVGATYPEQARRLRELLPNTLFLVPGYGAQGGAAKDVAPAFREDGLGAIVNSSRGLIFAFRDEPYRSTYGAARYAEAARAATEAMARELRKVLK